MEARAPGADIEPSCGDPLAAQTGVGAVPLLTLFSESTRNSSRDSRLAVCYGSGVATSSKQALLCQAADLIGRDQLASGLKISAALLDSWLSGRASMPDRQLSALADLLEEISNSPKQ